MSDHDDKKAKFCESARPAEKQMAQASAPGWLPPTVEALALVNQRRMIELLAEIAGHWKQSVPVPNVANVANVASAAVAGGGSRQVAGQQAEDDHPFGRVVRRVRDERAYQKRRWGVRRTNACRIDDAFRECQKTVGEYLVYIDHHLTEAKRLLSTTSGTDAALDAMRKVTALCVALGEQHGFPARNPLAPVTNGHDGLPA